MSIGLAYKRLSAPRRAGSRTRQVARLLLALALAICFGAFLGAGLAQAAPHPRVVPATLAFTAPNTKGLIGGPPGAKTIVRGGSWIAYSSVDLYVRPGLSGCSSGVSLGTFPTDGSGALAARFLWPSGANQLADYHVCGVQSGKGTAYSHNTFTVLATSAPQVSATPSSTLSGNTLTVNGSNWVPGPQTISMIILPCSSLCSQAAVATGQAVTDQNGAFSLKMTISAQAPSGTYYIQATNGQSTLSAVSQPLQISGQGQASGTPVPGISPTSVATRSSQGGAGGTTPKANNTIPALKDALLAAAVGIGALALLIGAGIFVLRLKRSRSPAPARARQRPAGAAPLEQFGPGSAVRKATTGEWQSPYRENYPPERPALPPVTGRVRREQGAQEDEPEITAPIWEGEARTSPDLFEVPSSFSAATAPHSAAEKLPSEQVIYQAGNIVEADDPPLAPPFQGMGRPAAQQTLRPHRPQPPGRPPFRPTGEHDDR